MCIGVCTKLLKEHLHICIKFVLALDLYKDVSHRLILNLANVKLL